MSGSPVYIEGRLAGAIALAFPFSKEPIAGIRPIEEMLAAGGPAIRQSSRVVPPNSQSALANISTPLAFHGFTENAVEHFVPELRKLGLEPRQGISSGANLAPEMGDPSQLHPGDMISVQLLSGDMNIGADGTITAIRGNRVYAFGHQFLASGTTELPFARAQVITLLPSVNTSFKIDSPLQWMGSITEDRNTTIAGELGRRAATIPLSIRLESSRGGDTTYQMRMVSDPVLSPLLVQMALFSVIESAERSVGPSTYAINGTATFRQGIPPLRFDNAYAGETGVPSLVSSGIASSIGYALSLGIDSLRLTGVAVDIHASQTRRMLNISRITASRREASPGETVDLFVTLSNPDGTEQKKKVSYPIPVGSPAGPLQFTVSDATAANIAEYARFLATPPRSAPQAIDFLNGLRDNRRAYLRVVRGDAAFTAGGETLPDPPPSLALILAKDQSSWSGLLGQGSKLDEIVIDSGGSIVSGSQSVQIQIKQ